MNTFVLGSAQGRPGAALIEAARPNVGMGNAAAFGHSNEIVRHDSITHLPSLRLDHRSSNRSLIRHTAIMLEHSAKVFIPRDESEVTGTIKHGATNDVTIKQKLSLGTFRKGAMPKRKSFGFTWEPIKLHAKSSKGRCRNHSHPRRTAKKFIGRTDNRDRTVVDIANFMKCSPETVGSILVDKLLRLKSST